MHKDKCPMIFLCNLCSKQLLKIPTLSHQASVGTGCLAPVSSSGNQNLKNWDDRHREKKDKSQEFLCCCHTGFSQAITSYFPILSPQM